MKNPKPIFLKIPKITAKLADYRSVIIDSKVASLYKLPVISSCLVINCGEKTKSIRYVNRIIAHLLKSGAERGDRILAIGGGALLDLCGFCASIYKRGGVQIDFVPTTLLAMVDAAIGGKNSVNFSGKNIIGTFYLPDNIFVSTDFLKSLTQKMYLSGLAEIIKIALLLDDKLLQLIQNKREEIILRNTLLLKKIITRAIELKMRIVKKDPYEKGLRSILNYGHTIGHAIEADSNFQISHGEAVAKGIAFETYFLNSLGVISDKQLKATIELLHLYGFDLTISKRIVKYLRYDKKNKRSKICIVAPVH